MSTTIIATKNWGLDVAINLLQRPTDHFHLMLSSKLRTAKNPKESITLFQATFSRQQLASLRDDIDAHLAVSTTAEVEGYPV